MSVRAYWSKISTEIGLRTLLGAGCDVYLIILLRMIRLIGFGGVSLILVLYLKELHFHEEYIGLFMTLTFLGDLVTSFVLSVTADQVGRKNVMILSSVAMTLTGLVYAVVENHYILTATAVIGILTPSGGEVGPFRSIEQSAIASLMPSQHRSDIYAWYTFLGTFCAAIGSVACGVLITFTNDKLGLTLTTSYKIAFMGYTILAFISVVLSLLLSNNIEPDVEPSVEPSSQPEPGETTGLLASERIPEPEPVQTVKKSRFLPNLQPSTYLLVLKLSLLFGLDSFASSLVPISWQSFYIKNKFHISTAYLGSIFFTTSIVSGFTSLLSTSLTKRLGAVATMVITHLPASILLGFVPVSNSLHITLAILVLRSSTQSMDVAPKHVFLAALIPDSERTAVFGWVNVVKTLGQTFGPVFVGLLSGRHLQWVTFIIASALKSIYDLGMLATFLAYNHHAQH